MELESKILKTIIISKAKVLLNEGSTDEKTVTSYRVEVTQQDGSSVVEPFPTLAEAQAYAADLCQRDLKPFNFSHMLDRR